MENNITCEISKLKIRRNVHTIIIIFALLCKPAGIHRVMENQSANGINTGQSLHTEYI